MKNGYSKKGKMAERNRGRNRNEKNVVKIIVTEVNEKDLEAECRQKIGA